MVGLLQPFAERHQFIVVAPDSGYVEEIRTHTWRVSDAVGPITQDLAHARRCLDELQNSLKVAVSEAGWLALGFSGGGSSAPYAATNDDRFSAFAVLHGGVYPGGMGAHHPRGWFSTGNQDPARPPHHVMDQVNSFRRARPDDDVTVRFYDIPHTADAHELEDVMTFWLRTSTVGE